MKLQVTTTYENIDDEWLDWYLKRLANEDILPGSTGIVGNLRTDGTARHTSKDPTSECVATTAYRIEKNGRPFAFGAGGDE